MRKIRGIRFPMGMPPECIELDERPYGGRSGPSLLDALYDAIKTDMVEKVTVGDGIDIVCDENGRIVETNAAGEPSVYNRTWMVMDASGPIGPVAIVGHAVAIGSDESRGEWRSLTTDEAICALQQVIGMNDMTKDIMPTFGQITAWITEGRRW